MSIFIKIRDILGKSKRIREISIFLLKFLNFFVRYLDEVIQW